MTAPTACLDCTRPLVPRRRHPPKGHVRHAGRNLCDGCRQRRAKNGTPMPPLTTWPADDLLTEWDLLRRQGHTMRQACDRLGVTYDALDQAIARAKRRGDTRAVRTAA